MSHLTTSGKSVNLLKPLLQSAINPPVNCPECGQPMTATTGSGLRVLSWSCSNCTRNSKSPERTQNQMRRADDGQVGGDHYKSLRVTPWDLIKAMEPSGLSFVDYARGDIIAYVARLKGSKEDRHPMLDKLREDLLKAAHYAKDAADHIAEHLAIFEKDEELRRQGQGDLFECRLSEKPLRYVFNDNEGPVRVQVPETQLELPLQGDFR